MHATVILGAGGHAKVIIEILREGGLYQPVGCLSHPSTTGVDLLGVPRLGDDSLLPTLRRKGIRHAFVALGDNRRRQQLMQFVQETGLQLANAISAASVVAPSAKLGCNVAVMAGALVGTDARVSDGVIVNSHASIDHDGQLGACCHIGPGATLAGNVCVGELAFVATGASVIPQITIGARTILGAGAVAVRDLPADVIAYGVPARPRRMLNPESNSNELRAAS